MGDSGPPFATPSTSLGPRLEPARRSPPAWSRPSPRRSRRRARHGTRTARHTPNGSTVTGASLLWIALALTAAFALVEAVGGWLAGSLALISDAGHMVTDAASFVVALIAATVTARPPSERASYGYARAEVIAAFVNALAMLALIVWIAVEAVAPPADAVAGGGPDRDGGRRGAARGQPDRRVDAVAPRARDQRARGAAARARATCWARSRRSSRAPSSTGRGGCRSTRSCRSSSRC